MIRCARGLAMGFLCASLLFAFCPFVSAGQTKAEQSEYLTRSIRCSIQTECAEWNPNSDSVIEVRIENLTQTPLSIEVVPTLYLRAKASSALDSSYWAPVDLVRGAPLGIDKRSLDKKGKAIAIEPQPIRLQFQGDNVLCFRIDAQNVKWDREISSVWPSVNLFSVVKSGVYDLQLVLEAELGLAKSNQVTVKIESTKSSPAVGQPKQQAPHNP